VLASYGGYSAFYLAGIHNNRFKTFIAMAFSTPSICLAQQKKFSSNWDFGDPIGKKKTMLQNLYYIQPY
jgi:pimeloyl-ACP methyl ester carboxylesterase